MTHQTTPMQVIERWAEISERYGWPVTEQTIRAFQDSISPIAMDYLLRKYNTEKGPHQC